MVPMPFESIIVDLRLNKGKIKMLKKITYKKLNLFGLDELEKKQNTPPVQHGAS